VVPWHDRTEDVVGLLEGLRELNLCFAASAGSIELRLHVVLVDNASTESLPTQLTPRDENDAGRASLEVESLRLDENRGGSGGFNAGIARALEQSRGRDDGYVWLVDSDARVTPDALVELVRVLEERPELCAVGSALADPDTGEVYEVGGCVDRRTGVLGPAGAAGLGDPVPCDYVASCSALVRLVAVRATGSLPDLFLHGDDAAWMLRMQRRTGSRVAGVARSVVHHPRFDRFQLRGRYYAARNGMLPLLELGLGRGVALRRSLREVARAVQQELLGRSDLAGLHLAGLADAAAGAVTGPGRGLDLPVEPFASIGELVTALASEPEAVGGSAVRLPAREPLGLSQREHDELRDQLTAAGLRVEPERTAGRAPWAVVPAAGRGAGLLGARRLIEVVPAVRGTPGGAGFVLRRGGAGRSAARAIWTAMRGAREMARLVWRWRRSSETMMSVFDDGSEPAVPAPGLSVVIVSHNRRDTLRRALRRISEVPALASAEILVVDNASRDGSVTGLEEEFDRVRTLRLQENLGVGAFNLGVATARADTVLVLDDDAWPDERGVAGALRVLGERPEVAAVTLHPRHPTTGGSEWRFAELGVGGRDDWPVMGCGNLIRRSAWLESGGYEAAFFLYRNDVDLALKLLGAGWRVHFDPDWVVWHESLGAQRKSDRWHRLATRNWVWLAKRHGRGFGLGGWLGGLLGLLWAHRLAGLRVGLHWATLRGAAEGLRRGLPSPLGIGTPRSSPHFGRVVRLAMGKADAPAPQGAWSSQPGPYRQRA
jgi:GT2 family glycosyltransferase